MKNSVRSVGRASAFFVAALCGGTITAYLDAYVRQVSSLPRDWYFSNGLRFHGAVAFIASLLFLVGHLVGAKGRTAQSPVWLALVLGLCYQFPISEISLEHIEPVLVAVCGGSQFAGVAMLIILILQYIVVIPVFAGKRVALRTTPLAYVEPRS